RSTRVGGSTKRVRRSKPIVERNSGEKSKRSMTTSSFEQYGSRHPLSEPGACHKPCGPRMATARDLGSDRQARVKSRPLVLDAKALEALVETGELAAAVEQAVLPAGPRGMRFR